MADLVLSDGRQITFDLSRMTIKEYRGLFDSSEDENKSDETVARVAGLTAEELQSLPYPDYKRMANRFFAKCREPLADPN